MEGNEDKKLIHSGKISEKVKPTQLRQSLLFNWRYTSYNHPIQDFTYSRTVVGQNGALFKNLARPGTYIVKARTI